MKRHYSLLLLALLSQTTPVWAMWNEADESALRQVGNGQLPVSTRYIRMETSLPPHIDQLDPSDPLPSNLGTARQRVSCTFADNNTVEYLLPTVYPLSGQWFFQEDRDNTQNLATLKLSALINNQNWREVYKNQKTIHHELVSSGEEIPGRYYFDGDSVYQALIKSQQWKNPRNNQLYTRIISTNTGEIRTHQGNRIVYTEPFAYPVGAGTSRPKDTYRGEYDFCRELSDAEGLQGREQERLLYSNGSQYFFPKITQELWKTDDQSLVGFFIASYKHDAQLNFIPGALIPEGRLPEGLYRFLSIQEEANRRLEKWVRVGENPHQVEITVPLGLASIPGMRALAPREISLSNAVPQIVQLQTNMERSTARIEEINRYIAAHHHAEGLDVIIGPSGHGKSVLAHLLAGRQLEAYPDLDGILRLDTNDRLPGFIIGHGASSGTTFPAVWYDDVHNRFIADCPGFGDPEGADRDILNAFFTHHLLENRGKIKVVVTVREADVIGRFGPFVKLLNDVTEFFQNDDDLRNNLSFVITHQRQVRNGFGPLLVRNLDIISQLNERSRNLLRFIAESPNRISSIPEVQQEGPFDFDIRASQTAIEDSHYVNNPRVRMGIGTDARLLVSTFGQSLNDYLTNYMGTEGAQRIINFCRGKISAHNGSVNQLRASLTNVIRDLRVFQQISANEPEHFVNNLRRFINVDDIERIISQISFLRSIGENVVYQISSWTNTLLPTIEKIDSLTTAPTVEMHGDELYLKASFLGTSDIQEAITRHPDLPVRAYAWNTIFFDSNITNHGKSFVAIAPQWKVSESITIDLSGLKGVDGADGLPGINAAGGDGQPGYPGQNGGHFYGKVFFSSQEDLKHLTINTSGGPGGNGGDGGKGVDGVDGDLNFNQIKANYPLSREGRRTRQDRGKDQYSGVIGRNGQEKIPESSHSVPAYRANSQSGSYSNTHRSTQHNFRDEGSLATSGGKGGKGGLGAYAGSSSIDNSSFPVGVNSLSLVANPVIDGDNGNPGEQGLPGRDCVGYAKVDLAIIRGGGDNLNKDTYECYETSKTYEPKNTPQVTQELNDVGQQSAAEQTSLNSDLIVQDFARNYEDAATNPVVASFVKIFAGLPNVK